MKTITLAQGNGGEENRQLISELFFRHLKNDILQKAEDAAVVEDGTLAMTTDSFTVSPIFFAGGDIGKLSVCGTCNDLAMMAARPCYLTLSVVLEEGFETRKLEKIVRSIKKELLENGAKVVAGDTKVVPKGSVDQIFITTTGLGEVTVPGISASNVQKGDVIVVSRDIGRHGAAIFAAREGIELESAITSDCASLWPMVEKVIETGVVPHAMRDATRGGVAAVLNEWAEASGVCIEVDEGEIPVSETVAGICELLGFEPTALANEGTFLLAVRPEEAEKVVEILRSFPGNEAAVQIGEVTDSYLQKVILRSAWGTKRFMDLPTGELLPRIC
ncbi:hydrogenase expression/formation protein HypE [Hydrogenimonas cancrithermarum]|uniref:Hydrogenase expression/formation protein HypE n=1 Tax=Hydrogenimonas cancrithermarum TaxID=2993563 RepID=A0ABM8FJM4_9BACT|nr:hydrogenase expression/formation protein HypE [Hydrogenimonas cancrithermarum]BDY12487.1 hydrogenase expression/formation protein HypE [Hydrogenimonas cancrithermarum]